MTIQKPSPPQPPAMPPYAPANPDKLEGYWYAIIWGSLIVPCVGIWVIVILSSVMYYVWRRQYPVKARTINLHGWLAWLAGQVIWGGLYLLLIVLANAK